MSDPRDRQLIDSIREWAGRPPGVSPSAARDRVLSRLEERRSFRRRALLSLAAAVAAALLITIGVRLIPDAPGAVAPQATAVSSPPPSSTPVVAYELDSGTLLFVTLPHRQEAGSGTRGL